MVEVDLPGGRRLDVLWIPAENLTDWNMAPVLFEDPADTAPLGDRRPIVLLHGLLWSAAGLPFSPVMRPMLMWNFRRNEHAASLRRRFKIYRFDYPSFQSVQSAADSLISSLRGLYPDRDVPARTVVLVGHSLGGLVARAAMNTQGFGDAVSLSFTLATPHRGTLVGSFLRARRAVREHIGPRDYAFLRRASGLLLPPCPALDDIRWAGLDAVLEHPAMAASGVLAGHWLQELNARDAYLDRLIPLMGDCPTFTWPPQALPLELVRRLMERVDARLANCDPLVQLSSGTFEGAPVERIVSKNVSHADWVLRPSVLDPVLKRIAALD